MCSDSKQRFSDRVENYVKYRPHYPVAIIQLLKNQCGLNDKSLIADIGSGSGIFSKLLLDNGYTVQGVEPNQPMREAAEAYLTPFPLFTSVNGSAETTKLADDTVDLITCAQAYHWFRPDETKREFFRILKPGGHILLIWNIRKNNTPFMQDYENLLCEFGTDYKTVSADKAAVKKIEGAFLPFHLTLETIEHTTLVDWGTLIGRLLSCSYVPNETDDNYQKMISACRNLFDSHSMNGQVEFIYEAKCYLTQIS